MTNPYILDDQGVQDTLLRDPRLYGAQVQTVERIDTHGARVYLGGDRVLKLKRAVAYPYMDLSTVALREQACRNEVTLNRRTAPALYRGVVALCQMAAGEAFLHDDDPDLDRATVIDWAVDMNRFPQDRQLDQLARAGTLDAPVIDQLADRIADFHQAAAAMRRDNLWAMGWVVRDNAAELAEMAGTVLPDGAVSRLIALTDAAFAQHQSDLAHRTAAGWVRRCHGDLHLRNIVLLPDGPAPFDAIDFNDALAEVDALYDLAFLIMDLDGLGLRPLANRLLSRYLVRIGDLSGLSLVPLYLSVRAAVRAKIAASLAMTLVGGSAVGVDAARLEAVAYLHRAIDDLADRPAQLVAIGGLSGTGKTSVARALAPSLDGCPGALHLRSDAVRKRLAGVSEETRLPADYYTPAWHARTFETLHAYARTALLAGRSVVLDGVYGRTEDRAEVEGLARSVGVPFQGIWLEADLATRAGRIIGRTHDASDADISVAARQAAWHPGKVSWSVIDARGDLHDIVARARASISSHA